MDNESTFQLGNALADGTIGLAFGIVSAGIIAFLAMSFSSKKVSQTNREQLEQLSATTNKMLQLVEGIPRLEVQIEAEQKLREASEKLTETRLAALDRRVTEHEKREMSTLATMRADVMHEFDRLNSGLVNLQASKKDKDSES